MRKDNCYYEFPPMKSNLELAQAYVPPQVMERVYNSKEALKRGTLFPELYIPYKTNKKCKW